MDERSAMDEVFGENPQRPDTPDLWRVSSVLLRHDSMMDELPDPTERRQAWEARVGELMDVDTARFVAEQRILRAFGPEIQQYATTSTGGAGLYIRLVATVMDALMTGIEFERQGGHRPS